MTPNEKMHIKGALDWLNDAQKMIERQDLKATSESVQFTKMRLLAALALGGPTPRKVKA